MMFDLDSRSSETDFNQRAGGLAVSFLAAVTAVMSPDFRRRCNRATDVIKLSGTGRCYDKISRVRWKETFKTDTWTKMVDSSIPRRSPTPRHSPCAETSLDDSAVLVVVRLVCRLTK